MADFPLSCYRFHLIATSPIVLPSFKGSTFHGGFSHALARVSPRCRAAFYPASQKQPNPFMLVPPLEDQTLYEPGETLCCVLMLFGTAVDQFMLAFAALETLGRTLGLGVQQGHYEIFQVEQLTLNGSETVFVEDQWLPRPENVQAGEILHASAIPADGVSIHLLTLMRLKNNNHLVGKPPSFSVFMDRLLGRISSLASFYGRGSLFARQEKILLLRQAGQVRLNEAQTTARWQEWQRPDKPGREPMLFGGLLGSLSYTGDVGPCLPWLSLGQWTGIGGKTSFGLGLYHIEIHGEDDDFD
ncbi:CRISPR system precrRNA processing endoribonuclease RAMP protein Cas6 [Desulfobulbus propionicus]